MLATAIAVLGTLLGAIVAGAFQQKTAGRAERAATTAQLRRDRLDAVTELAAAGSDHRRAMWMRGEAVLNGAPAEQVQELRRASVRQRRGPSIRRLSGRSGTPKTHATDNHGRNRVPRPHRT
ncbi:hypothetical protein ACWEF9_23585 [Streptomyces sp. NPDC004980]